MLTSCLIRVVPYYNRALICVTAVQRRLKKECSIKKGWIGRSKGQDSMIRKLTIHRTPLYLTSQWQPASYERCDPLTGPQHRHLRRNKRMKKSSQFFDTCYCRSQQPSCPVKLSSSLQCRRALFMLVVNKRRCFSSLCRSDSRLVGLPFLSCPVQNAKAVQNKKDNRPRTFTCTHAYIFR